MPCLVDRAGVQPTFVGDLPAQCAALDRTFLNVVELAVRAALEEDRAHVLQAVMLDPNAAATLSLGADGSAWSTSCWRRTATCCRRG